MVPFCRGFYCRKDILRGAVSGSSKKSSHVARRLIPGLFKLEAVLNSTVSGQSCRYRSAERMAEKCDTLHADAVTAIFGGLYFVSAKIIFCGTIFQF